MEELLEKLAADLACDTDNCRDIFDHILACGHIFCNRCLPLGEAALLCPDCDEAIVMMPFCGLHRLSTLLCRECHKLKHPPGERCPEADKKCPAAPACDGKGPRHLRTCRPGQVVDKLLKDEVLYRAPPRNDTPLAAKKVKFHEGRKDVQSK